ncbi:MAG: YlmC/YmxH family sporulation protein [Lachnospiraceae bacterium]|jgi:YlmC/YmxH family sporulation protein|nr:YlmC/YmxH family sporulation protein [Lachnospiraceae bacterium]
MLFSELKCKDVVNLKDCRKIGKICDLEFDVCSGKICCVYITAKNRWCNIFSAEDKICVPYKDIRQIGPDLIIVDICSVSA